MTASGSTSDESNKFEDWQQTTKTVNVFIKMRAVFKTLPNIHYGILEFHQIVPPNKNKKWSFSLRISSVNVMQWKFIIDVWLFDTVLITPQKIHEIMILNSSGNLNLYWTMLKDARSTCLQMFFKIGFFKNFTYFTGVFSVKFAKTFKNTFFTEYLQWLLLECKRSTFDFSW